MTDDKWYSKEDILIHEFSHTVMVRGASRDCSGPVLSGNGPRYASMRGDL